MHNVHMFHLVLADMNPRPYPLQCLKGSAGQFDTGATIICFIDNNAHKLNVLFTKIIKIETVCDFYTKINVSYLD